MLDWAKIAANAEYALTLDASALTSYLDSIEGTQEEFYIKRLLQQAHQNTGFLATSAPGDINDDSLLENGTVIGSWEITNHLGRGGMGDVYQARRADGLYEQTVALKLIQGLSESRTALFEIERRRLAMMNHPGIARIIDGGSSGEGRPYMVMEYVDGVPITDYVVKNGLGLKSKLKLFLSVCSSVEHAHGQLTLHRDIKAQNVLVDAQATTRLIDFGISSEMDDDQVGKSAFSLASAAPEQLKGESASVQTDVFALGILLHELIANKHPLRLENGGMQADKLAIANADLFAIIEKALSLEAKDRYSSTSLLREDVKAFIKNYPVSSRQGGWAYSTSKFIQRYPIANTFALIAILSLAGGLAASLNFANHAQMEAVRANSALAESEKSLAQAKFYLTRADLFHAMQSAYAGMLQSMFGANADVETQTRVLKERWQQAYELRHDDPDTAAFLSYAIGRHFLFRNDYLTAIEILQPWVEEQYGPEALLGYARQLLAIAYFSVGRERDALPLLRKTEKWLASGFDAASPDHIATATQIAILTESDIDIMHAEELLLKGLESEIQDPIKMYFWNQASKMREMRGDFQGAYEAMKQVVNIIEEKPLMEISGTDTGLLNLASFELWHTQDLKRAEELAGQVIKTVLAKKGESRELGIAYSVLANTYLLASDAEEALKHSEKALSIIQKYSGMESDTAILEKIKQAEIYALLNKSEASNMIRLLMQQIEKSNQAPRILARAKLADVFINLQLNGIDSANSRYLELAPNREVIDRSVELSYMLKRLASLGVAFEAKN